MSKNRENVTWQSKDGSWNIGFYDYHEVRGDDDDEYDAEWDVEYTDDFHWVSAGHPSAASAERAWTGASPGGGERVSYDEASKEKSEYYDDQAAKLYKDTKNPPGGYSRTAQYGSYQGTPKQRVLKYLASDYYNDKLREVSYAADGYTNSPDPRTADFGKDLKERLKTASADELAAASEVKAKFIKKAEEKIEARANPPRSRFGGGGYYDPDGLRKKRQAIEKAKAILEDASKLSIPTKKVPKAAPAQPVKKAAPAPSKSSEGAGGGSAGGSSGGTAGKFHINPETGRANICRATKRPCEYASDGHYPDKGSARKAYESKMGDGLDSVSKKKG